MEVSTEIQVQIAETKVMSDGYNNYAIETAEKYQGAADDLRKIKSRTKELDETRKSLTRPIEESKKRIIALFKEPLDYLKRAEDAVKRAMVGWQNEQEKIRQAEQARLADIQRQEAEKLRLEAAKEAARVEKLKTAAAKANAAAKAEELKAKAEAVAAIEPVVESNVEDVAGISTKKVWKFKIVDLNKIPRKYMIPDEKYIGQIVRASKGTETIEGIEIYSENVISSRANVASF